MYNKVILIGRLTKDWELKYTTNGTAVATSTLAVDSGFGDKKKTDFLPLVVWQKQAENAATYTKKGSLISVDGRISTRNFDGKDGKKVYITEIIAEGIKFLDSKKEGATGHVESSIGKEVSFDADDIPW